MPPQKLGDIVSSESHSSYIVSVDDQMKTIHAPTAEQFGLGTFVSATVGDLVCVGVIADSRLSNPAFQRMGPRLTAEPDPLFAPDLIVETQTLLRILLIGQCTADRSAGIHQMPRVVLPINASAYCMEPEEILAFHRRPDDDRFYIGYYATLLAQGGTYSDAVCQYVLEQLKRLSIPNEILIGIRTLEKHAAWQRTMTMFH